jgi:hypothetical protein
MAINWNKEQPAPRALWNVVHFCYAQTRFLGIYVKRNIAGTNTPSLHAEGRALDIGLLASRPAEKGVGDQLVWTFVDMAKSLQLQEIIWNGQIWSSTKPYMHKYTGANPHTDHVHVGFTREGSQQQAFPLLAQRFAVLLAPPKHPTGVHVI